MPAPVAHNAAVTVCVLNSLVFYMQIMRVNSTSGHTTRRRCALKSHIWITEFFGHTTRHLVHLSHWPHLSGRFPLKLMLTGHVILQKPPCIFVHLQKKTLYFFQKNPWIFEMSKNTGGFLQNYQRKTDWHVGFVTCVHQKSSCVTKKSRSPVVWLKCT